VEQEIKDGVWKEHLASNKISPKKKMLVVPTKIITAEFQALEALDAQAPVVSDNANIFINPIGRLPIKFFGSNKFIDIVKEVNTFITTRFEIKFQDCDRKLREPTAKKERLKFDNHVKKCVEDYTTYILVDVIVNNDYHLGGPNNRHKNSNKRTRTVCVMVVEKLIHVATTRLESCLKHFLCTYPTLQGRGYAKRLMAVVFSQPDMMNKNIYAVTRLPEGYEPIDVIKTEEDRVLFEKFAFYSDMNNFFSKRCFLQGTKIHPE